MSTPESIRWRSALRHSPHRQPEGPKRSKRTHLQQAFSWSENYGILKQKESLRVGILHGGRKWIASAAGDIQASGMQTPRSPKDEIAGLPYFPRLCDKIRLKKADQLDPEYHPNLGKGMDLWTCQYLGVDYKELEQQVIQGANDPQALEWARQHGCKRTESETDWWCSFMRNRGFRDDLSHRLQERKAESGLGDREDIQSFMDYIDADEGRMAQE